MFFQSELNGKGRFQVKDENTIRYIIGDLAGILLAPRLFIWFTESLEHLKILLLII